MREKILDLLAGKKIDGVPAFSGLIHVTAEGLQSEGLVFHEVHKDAGRMARAAASTFKLSGLPSAVVPLDLYVEAEALGAQINFRESGEYEFPQVSKAKFASVRELVAELSQGMEIPGKGRIQLVCEAIRLLKEAIGDQAVIGGMIPGPYTLLLLIVEPGKMFLEMKKEPQVVHDALMHLSSFLAQVGVDYRDAGADFITIHDMGGSPAFSGPTRYEQFVLPAEQSLSEKLAKPRVLSVCGSRSKAMQQLGEHGAAVLDQLHLDGLVGGYREPAMVVHPGPRHRRRHDQRKLPDDRSRTGSQAFTVGPSVRTARLRRLRLRPFLHRT